MINALTTAAEENQDPLHECEYWRVVHPGDKKKNCKALIVPAKKGDRGAVEKKYFIMVNEDKQFFVAAQSVVRYKRVLAIVNASFGSTSPLEERDYKEFARCKKIKRLEREERRR